MCSSDLVVTIGEKNGLPMSTVTGIVPGSDGHVWLETPLGIVRISSDAFDLVRRDPAATIGYSVYDTEDGMAGLPVSFGSQSAVRAADGRMWFVTTNGITIVDPRIIRDDSAIPPVHIEGIVADARRVDPLKPRLAPNTSTIEIEYSAVTFSSPTRRCSSWRRRCLPSPGRPPAVARPFASIALRRWRSTWTSSAMESCPR